VRIDAGHREHLERLCRYLARPPISQDRLSWLPDGRVSLRLKTPFSDGTTHLALTPHAFIERLCALIPRPRSHRVRYHGVFAPASPLRPLVVPRQDEDEPLLVQPVLALPLVIAGNQSEAAPTPEKAVLVEGMPTIPPQPELLPARVGTGRQVRTRVKTSTRDGVSSQTSPRRRVRWILWSVLIRRVFDNDSLRCPKCCGRMTVIAAIVQADVIAKILRCLEAKNLEAPAMRPARAPPACMKPGEDRLIELDF